MDIRTAAKNVIEHKGSIAKSADFVAAGIRAGKAKKQSGSNREKQ